MLSKRISRLEADAPLPRQSDTSDAEAVAFLNRFATLKAATCRRELSPSEQQEYAEATAIMAAAIVAATKC